MRPRIRRLRLWIQFAGGRGWNVHLMVKLSVLSALIAPLLSCTPLRDLDELTRPRFQTGKKKGAVFCGSCHQDTYRQWSRHSRHAEATKSRSFRRALSELKENIVVGGIVDEDMCYACHGDKKSNEGIN